MNNTTHLNLPYISAAQAQKHVTHNEALRALDAIVQLSVLDRDISTPPSSPNEGDRYIVATGASGDWTGQEHNIAAFQDGAWAFYSPNTGWLAWVVDETLLVGWEGASWVVSSGGSGGSSANLNPATGGLVGINATADTTNRLSVNSPATLFNHEGDSHQVKVNKNANTDTASVLFQTGFSGRAEFGLTGDDDFHMKVSPDGSTFHEGLVIDKDDGVTSVKGLRNIDTGVTLSSVVFTPGGDGVVSFYRVNTTHKENPRTLTISAVSGDTVTITTGNAETIFYNSAMNGVSYIRIWNTSKVPAQSAWVKAQPASNQITVLDENDVSGWLNGETLQLGDPDSIVPGRVIAIDISPMLQNLFGTVFPQKGIVCKSGFAPENGFAMALAMSPSGEGGSFISSNSPTDGSWTSSLLLIPCSIASPISNSNLIFVREHDFGGNLGITLITSIAVFV